MKMRDGGSHVACVLVVLALAAMAVPPCSAAVSVNVNDEAGLRAAFANSAVSEIVVMSDVSLMSGLLRVPPGRVLSMRGACGASSTSACTLNAHALSRHLHVTPGADVRVRNFHLVNGSAVNAACTPHMQTMAPGRDLRVHLFTSQLNTSTFYGIGDARRGCVAHVKGVSGGI